MSVERSGGPLFAIEVLNEWRIEVYDYGSVRYDFFEDIKAQPG